MAYRSIKNSDIVGKTVSFIENESVNVLVLNFTDGTKLELWAEVEGNLPHIYVDDSFVMDQSQIAAHMSKL
jgi:hypothetical protein